MNTLHTLLTGFAALVLVALLLLGLVPIIALSVLLGLVLGVARLVVMAARRVGLAPRQANQPGA